jgi:hypothetical protein
VGWCDLDGNLHPQSDACEDWLWAGELRYNGVLMELRLDVTEMTDRGGWSQRVELKDVVTTLRRGHAVRLTLQPGDATRYDFVITPVASGPSQTGLLVQRFRGGDPDNWPALVWDWDGKTGSWALDDAADRCVQRVGYRRETIDNPTWEWSRSVCRWLLGHLCGEYVRALAIAFVVLGALSGCGRVRDPEVERALDSLQTRYENNCVRHVAPGMAHACEVVRSTLSEYGR